MDITDYQEDLKSGIISAAISLPITYGFSLVYPTSDIAWVLTAVGFAAFFSGYFTSQKA